MAPEQAEVDGKGAPPEVTIESSVEHAKRAFALKKFEQAVDHYATALELITEKFGDDASETADLYFSYGKALLENAISQNSVLGKEQPDDSVGEENKGSGSSTSGNGPILSFSGDAEDFLDDDPAVDLFTHAETLAEAEKEEDDEEGDDAEPEDDFNAAWEVLDLARAIYGKQLDASEDDEVKLKLADTYIALGDVSLETEKFDQAITDYETGLGFKIGLLPVSSRQVAEAHYKLSMVLDLTSGRLADAILHAGAALQSVESRLEELQNGLLGQMPPADDGTSDPKGKGKGKQTGGQLVRDDLVQNMSKTQIETEIKELEGLKEDLALKVEELKTTPNEPAVQNAPALAAQSLDKELNASSSTSTPVDMPVNDLTSMVVKKKKKIVEESPSKRKAEDNGVAETSEKKAKLGATE